MASRDSDDVAEHGEVDEHSVDRQTDTISSSSNAPFTLLAHASTSGRITQDATRLKYKYKYRSRSRICSGRTRGYLLFYYPLQSYQITGSTQTRSLKRSGADNVHN